MRSFWLTGIILLAAASCAKAPIAIKDAQVRGVIPGSDKSVGYFLLSNSTSKSVELISAQSAQVRAIEFHQTFLNDDGMSRMRRLKSVAVPAGESVRFEPGGRHLMLFGVTELTPPVIIKFATADGEAITAEFSVVSPFTD